MALVDRAEELEYLAGEFVMWKLIKAKWSQKLEGAQKGKPYHSNINYRNNYQLQTTTKVSITDPKRISTGKNHQLWAPTEKDVYCICYKKLTTPATQAMRNCHHPELLIFSEGLCWEQPLPTFSFSSIKQHFSPLFVGLAHGFVIFGMSQIAILCHSQMNPYLLVK